MANAVVVDLSKEALEAPAEMERRIAMLRGRELAQQVGRGVANLFKEHFWRLDAERANDLGGQRTHFWGNAAKSVASYPVLNAEDGSFEALVVTSQLGVRQRLEGGTIKPREGKYLTIPARAEAYGRRAREFKGLKFVPLADGRGMLVAKEDARIGKRGLGKANEGLVMYWLVPSVVQQPDSTVLPKEEIVRAVVKGTIDRAWARREGRQSR